MHSFDVIVGVYALGILGRDVFHPVTSVDPIPTVLSPSILDFTERW